MNLPSVKTLAAVTSYPKELRKLLETRSSEELNVYLDQERFKSVDSWVRSCFHLPNFHSIQMALADVLCETCGVERISKGRGAKSPAIEYCNTGDTYAATLLYVNGRYSVGCWGDIVERGDYD
jgi:hypothetical protein